jgi:Zn-dependent M28 family amino/carboxypeptidase
MPRPTLGGSVVRRHVLALVILCISGCRGDLSTPAAAVPELSGSEISEYMRTLSSDAFLGRGPGSPGGRMAADYIASHFRAFGLEGPAGSYLQPFPIVGNLPVAETVSLRFTSVGGAVRAGYLDDFVLNPGNPEAEHAEGEGELVFVGYGIDAPDEEWDDFDGVDVRGKYLLILVNDPPAPAGEPDRFGGVAMTYYGRWTYKYEEAARQGALGALVVHETERAGYPWSVVRGGFAGEQFSLPPDPMGPAPPELVGWISHDLAREVLSLGGYDFEELKESAATRGFNALPTGITVRGALDSRVRRVDTQNVVGVLPGSERPDEYVLVTAHYDHFGVGEPIDGDSIYNGAYDNASGTALIMTMGHALASMQPAPARSIVFIATGAEEQGLLGAEWYVQAPLFPLDRTVAELNFDGANLWGVTTDAVVRGADRSELGAYVQTRATEMGITLLPDPDPQAGMFFRSDHFPFARAGVPSLYIEHGRQYVGRPPGWGDRIQAEYTANHYHAPSDEFSDGFVFDGAVQQGRLGMLTILDIAGDESWPAWYDGQEFKTVRDEMMADR